MMAKLQIENLFVEVEGKEILRGFNLTMQQGEIHALMGPNGTGKSTLSYAIMGHPRYKVTAEDILLDGESILGLSTHQIVVCFWHFNTPSQSAASLWQTFCV